MTKMHKVFVGDCVALDPTDPPEPGKGTSSQRPQLRVGVRTRLLSPSGRPTVRSTCSQILAVNTIPSGRNRPSSSGAR